MKKAWLKDLIFYLVVIVIVFLLQQFVVANTKVSGPSMFPTLKDGERVVGWKHSKIKRFDIVTFPAIDPEHKGDQFVKRVIGLPGDTVAYKNDVLYINGKKYKEPYLDTSKKKLLDGNLFTEDFTFKDLKDVLHGATKVPKGKVFVMGDNRLNSSDSRMFGFIDQKTITGNLHFRYYPFNKMGSVH